MGDTISGNLDKVVVQSYPSEMMMNFPTDRSSKIPKYSMMIIGSNLVLHYYSINIEESATIPPPLVKKSNNVVIIVIMRLFQQKPNP